MIIQMARQQVHEPHECVLPGSHAVHPARPGATRLTDFALSRALARPHGPLRTGANSSQPKVAKSVCLVMLTGMRR